MQGRRGDGSDVVLGCSPIMACASAAGWSGRAIVRASGDGVFDALDRVLGSPLPRARGVGSAELVLAESPRRVGLPVLITRLPAPSSYTGEDSVEVLLPGNPHLVARVLQRLAREGFAFAQPGEFTARAFLRGKLSLEQAEAVGAMIAADSRERVDAARRLHDGEVGAAYRRFADEGTSLLALVEAGIDFTDQEDVVPIAPSALAARLGALIDGLDEHLRGVRGEEAGRALPEVALVGRPNAGKSTLFNALLGRARAVASPVAGTTRDVLREELDLSHDAPGAGAVALLDLPGLDLDGLDLDGLDLPGPDPGASARAAQRAARVALRMADVLVWCDPHARFDHQADPDIARGATPTLRVRTCADRPLGHELPPGALAVCAVDGWNLGTLRRAIAEAACSSRGAGVAALLPRHRLALFATRDALEQARRLALASVERGPDAPLVQPEALAQCLRDAISCLGELVGTITPDDVLGRIFASFCVGK